MGKYVYIYYDQSEATDAPDKDSMAAWQTWFGKLGDKLTDGGNPFAGGGKAVEKSGITTIENYPATGYSIVEAGSIDEAADLAKDCPLLAADNTAVRVYEALPM